MADLAAVGWIWEKKTGAALHEKNKNQHQQIGWNVLKGTEYLK